MSDGSRPASDPAAASLPPELEARLAGLRELVHAGCTHYQLLGIPRRADRKAVKRAYYQLAALVHPDRHAGRELGSWKPVMEALFRHVTLAHDTLSDATQRWHYDETLPPESEPPPQAAAPSEPAVAASMQSEPPRVVTPPPLTRTPKPPSDGPGPASREQPPLSQGARTTPSDTARREALARRLLAGRPSARRQAAVAPVFTTPAAEPSSAPASQIAVPASDELRSAAEAAEFRGEFTSAMKSWRRLSILDPKNPEVAHRAAKALLNSKDANLHEAAELAKKAIMAAPQEYKNHLLLAEIYLQAQLPSAARSVLQHALSLGHGITELTTLLQRVESALKPPRK